MQKTKSQSSGHGGTGDHEGTGVHEGTGGHEGIRGHEGTGTTPIHQSSRLLLMWAGVFFGFTFPIVGTLLEASRLGMLSWQGVWQVQSQTPLLWIIDSAPLVLGLAGHAISPQKTSLLTAERQLLPLLLANLLVPLGLALVALDINANNSQLISDTNRSGALRYQCLYIYASKQREQSNWRPVLQKMEDSMVLLRLRYPKHTEPTEKAWQPFQTTLLKGEDVSWAATERMREAADRQTKFLELDAQQNRKTLIAAMTLGLISLLLGFAKSNDQLRNLRMARVAQQESEQRFMKLAEASFEGISLSQNGVVVSANDQLCRMFGYTPDEIPGMKADLFVAPEARESVRQKIEQNDENPYETIGLRKDGTTFPAEVEGKLVQFSGAPARVTAVRNLSERVRIETELREANRRLELLATTDELTGLFNRRAFNAQLKIEMERAQRYDNSLSLILLDIDKFKSLNDQWGHDYGDEVLQRVSRILQNSVRPSDYVARYGGEEMVILLPYTDREGAFLSAERCRLEIAQSSWPHNQVTASFGAATLTPTLTPKLNSPEMLIKAADEALYVSKESGRNRTTHFVDVTESSDSQ